jgi:hypothetical protein
MLLVPHGLHPVKAHCFSVNIKITQLDGALPNLAVMKLAHWHLTQGDQVLVTRRIEPDLFDPPFDRVYGSSIFSFSNARLERFKAAWPEAIIGGTGTENPITVEELIGKDWENYDYGGYEKFEDSIGFTQRGCRLKCKFCVVPKKEGKPRSVNGIYDIWRGDPWPKKLHLLDNDFFGQPREQWEKRIKEIQDGKFRVTISQGINIRLIDAASSEALASIQYRDTKFKERKLYTAWDNLRDEKVFFRGVERLEKAGIPPTHLRVYMLIGFDPTETWERIFYRFNAMVDLGIEPYPMVYNNQRKDLKQFQRWVVMGLYRIVPWSEYTGNPNRSRPLSHDEMEVWASPQETV